VMCCAVVWCVSMSDVARRRSEVRGTAAEAEQSSETVVNQLQNLSKTIVVKLQDGDSCDEVWVETL